MYVCMYVCMYGLSVCMQECIYVCVALVCFCALQATEQLSEFYSHWVLKLYSLVDSRLILTSQLQKQGPPGGAQTENDSKLFLLNFCNL
jgi:hypothetical protein